MQVEDRISIERAMNGYQVKVNNKILDKEYAWKVEDYVFLTFDEVVEWVKLQK